MALQEEDVRRIGEYVKPWLRDLVTEFVPRSTLAIDTQLLERMVRVEEELKSSRELMTERFTAMDHRFESMQIQMDKRFESMQLQMDKRFDAVDKRFDAVDKRFESVQIQMDKRFDAVDRRFESADRRFDDIQHSFGRTQWLMGLGFVLITAVVTVFGLLA